jgi:hypothetical protein
MEFECDQAGPSEPAVFRRHKKKFDHRNVERTKCVVARSQPERLLCQGAVAALHEVSGLTGQQTPSAPLRRQIVRSFCLRFIQLPSLFRSNPPLRCGPTGSGQYLVRMIAPPNRCRRGLSASRIEWHADVPAKRYQASTAVPETRGPHRERQLPLRPAAPVHWPRSSLHWQVREGAIHIALQHLHRCILLAKL